jgi:hypothetical protein
MLLTDLLCDEGQQFNDAVKLGVELLDFALLLLDEPTSLEQDDEQESEPEADDSEQCE